MPWIIEQIPSFLPTKKPQIDEFSMQNHVKFMGASDYMEDSSEFSGAAVGQGAVFSTQAGQEMDAENTEGTS